MSCTGIAIGTIVEARGLAGKGDITDAWIPLRDRESGESAGEVHVKFTYHEFKLEDFEFVETLGTGSFGTVKLARHVHTEKYFAMKILSKKAVMLTKQVEKVKTEKHLLSVIRHPFIVNCFAAFQDSDHLYICMEYVVGGEFFTHLRKMNRFPDDTAKLYGAQVLLALEHLHNNDIIYRDLKPENLLLDKKGNLKMTDFGFAKVLDSYKTWTFCGTPHYIAPEIIKHTGHGKAVDWWAFGILLFEMLAGYPPFDDDDRTVLFKKILAGKVSYPAHIEKDAKHLISKLLTGDITRRYGNLKDGVKDIKGHRWFRSIDWEALERKDIQPPIVPEVHGDDDTQNFPEYDFGDEEDLGELTEEEQALFADF